MKRVLILFATREGQTEKIATRISIRLKARGADTWLINTRDPVSVEGVDLNFFDLLVFGASLHAGGLEPELVRFVNAHREQIAAKPRAFFLVLLSAAVKDPQLRDSWLADARGKLNAQLPVEFENIEMIAGALKYSKYPLPLKWIMQRIAKQAGEGTDIHKDYEYTDWPQVDRYADTLLAAAD